MWSGISSVMSCASVQKYPSARVEVKKSEKKISKIVGGKRTDGQYNGDSKRRGTQTTRNGYQSYHPTNDKLYRATIKISHSRNWPYPLDGVKQ